LGSDISGTVIALCGTFATVVAILWGLWVWIDWSNDYYIVTNNRVIWLEKIILIYESHHEAPLEAVLSIDLNTDYVQRLWKTGDVVVNTYTGKIVMRNVDRPQQLAAMIEEYWERARLQTTKKERQQRTQLFRESLGFVEKKEDTPPETQPIKQTEKDPLLQRLSNFLKTRYEKNGTVTYRKHWFLLVRRVWVIFAISFFLLLYLFVRIFIMFASQGQPDLTRGILIPLGMLGTFILISSPWWIYHIIDWGNDIYQITDRHIYDIDRKPLGQDTKKSAPLERILNTSVKQTFWQKLLNYGTVVINVGVARFTFDNIHNPAMVQQEIFERYRARQKSIEAEEAKRDRRRMVEWLKIYYDQVDGESSPDHEPDFY
jgi:hypothetical protein